jgi:multicomponent Na+:H+ antiporter subunit B
MVMFGVYIFVNGHLSPGGGFQGGAVIASAVLLLFLSDINYKINHTVFGLIESFSGVFYVLIGVMGLLLSALIIFSTTGSCLQANSAGS